MSTYERWTLAERSTEPCLIEAQWDDDGNVATIHYPNGNTRRMTRGYLESNSIPVLMSRADML